MKKTTKRATVRKSTGKKSGPESRSKKSRPSPRKLVAKAAQKAQELGQDILDQKLLAIANRSIRTLKSRLPDLPAQALDQTVSMGERVLKRVKQAQKAIATRSTQKKRVKK